ncbi:MAG: DNA polymerase III subunit chi [Sphingomonadales bacterium]
MAQVSFYHLERQGVEAALPKLLEKVLAAELKVVVFLDDQALLKTLDDALWTYNPSSFLPHGTEETPHPDLQPVYLTTARDVPNEAQVVVLINAAKAPDLEAFERCLYMFDGREEPILTEARKDWTAMKTAGHDVTYWQQNQAGGWEKKA